MTDAELETLRDEAASLAFYDWWHEQTSMDAVMDAVWPRKHRKEERTNGSPNP